ncbi:hypothetical protein CHS0354_040981 [Potamilus streckersoni]|uniref:Glycoside hydrolase family 38 central domain-containing protein n=1 Tax=Potamilus streckersoni TaxID=2493646 RepID=A0AAE0T821_9BIVA|nr:hypothetical protein CHS0354_040981 [Potamilus streckersoni]
MNLFRMFRIRSRMWKYLLLITITFVAFYIWMNIKANTISVPAVKTGFGWLNNHEPIMVDSVIDDKSKHVTHGEKCEIPDRFDPGTKVISTFDLPDETNYTLLPNGRYSIPVKNKQVAYSPSLRPLKIILVPFSHADPGYGRTIQEYHTGATRSILTGMVQKLNQYRNLTFQWAETVFLDLWFEETDNSLKQQVRDIIARGQLEIVLGGWVMPDEACTHYVSVIDQLIEGHQWVLENLNVIPKNSWSNDPFGYSASMPYLWKLSGIENMVILRIHQAIKGTLMKKRSLEYKWRQYWDHDGRTDILSYLMPYENYWINDVCGPDADICHQYAFFRTDQAPAVTEQNLETKATALYEQYRITADLYKYDTLYMGLGEDFSYQSLQDWDVLYTNFKKLMDYMNAKKEWKVNIKFGTLAEYFSDIRRNEESSTITDTSQSFPVLSGDFFPYSDKNNEYWTGYFTTRPFNKRIAREIEPILRAADAFHVFAYSLCKTMGKEYKLYSEVTKHLRGARRNLGVFLHHDGITGTSLPHVVKDYEIRLHNAHYGAITALKMTLVTVLSRGKITEIKNLKEELMRPSSNDITVKGIVKVRDEGTSLVFVNPLGKARTEIVTVIVDRENVKLVCPHGERKFYQISKYSGNNGFQLAFSIKMSPYAVEIFEIMPSTSGNDISTVQSPNENEKTIVLQNTYLTVEFDSRTGWLRSIQDSNGKATHFRTSCLSYKSEKSGAYLFGPAGEAREFLTSKPQILVTKGKFVSEVSLKFPGFYHSIRLYNSSGPQGRFLHIKNEIDIAGAGLKEQEIIMRFESDVQNGDLFYTDSNGFQMMGRRTRPSNPIETNYYPLTSMAILEDENKRLVLHSAQPHGVASLKPGWLEVMLDRQMSRDDKKGLGQGVYDNKLVVSEFFLAVEYKGIPSVIAESRYTYPSMQSIVINEVLQNPIMMLMVDDSTFHSVDKYYYPVKFDIPCDVSIVGLRNLAKNDLQYNGTSIVVHKKRYMCGYSVEELQCPVTLNGVKFGLLFPFTGVAYETSLSHLHKKKRISLETDLTPDPMEIKSFLVYL